MERDGIGYISKEYDASDFLKLELCVDSSERDWNEAIKIFRDRMESRYWDVIERLEDDIYNNGFAIMALDCLLVDTFYQFRDPDNLQCVKRRRERYNRGNRDCYVDFLIKNFPDIFNDISADYFYKDIRCGILHSAQTKNGSQLTYGKNYVIELFDNDKIRVDVKNFTQRLKSYYYFYIEELENRNIPKRKKFIKQMRKICLH